MEKKNGNITSRIFLLSLCACVAAGLLFALIGKLGNFHLDPAFIILAAFVLFVCSFGALYYFYFFEISRNIERLSDKIKERLSHKEIPRKPNLLEEVDSIAELESRVDALIELREKEMLHIDNLDSYRKEYLGNVSHELKTPVFNIQGYIDTLLNGGLEDPNINRDYLERAERSINRLINIIDDLETITQLESGGMELDVDTFDIAALCKDIYSALELNAAKKNIKLELAKRYDKPVLAKADKFRIRQVLVNLVTNSIKYGKDNGHTIISLNYLNDEVIVEVSDDGPGIESKHLPRLFERFYRVDKGRSREQGGTGLGLAIVKHIIDVHGKSIQVESEPGKGTRFVFSLNAAG